MNIRRAIITDVPRIMSLVAEVVPVMIASGNFQWDNSYPDEAVFENDIVLNQLWVAEIDGLIAGVAALTTSQEPEYTQIGWDINEKAIVTHRLAVSVKYRNRGVAKALLMQADEVAKDCAINILRIDTNANNQATQQLFPKLGYVFAGEIGLSFRPTLKFYCYEKRVVKA